ncbi:MarR family winged helix-turn-helix transcriptional regulator [Mariniluteicoccus flavus]
MSGRAPLPFDPIEQASAQWAERFGEVERMRAITSVMRVQQLLQAQLDELLKPFGLTFARYEVLVLLSFSRRGSLPLGRIGERLQVHATSVTPLVNRLAAAGLIERRPHPEDGRAVLASLTDKGKRVLADATTALTDAEFGLGALTLDECERLTQTLTGVRREAGDFA